MRSLGGPTGKFQKSTDLVERSPMVTDTMEVEGEAP